MDEFSRIRKLVHDNIKDKQQYLSLVETWKDDIRGKLMLAKNDFNERIDEYVKKFSDQMNGIEKA